MLTKGKYMSFKFRIKELLENLPKRDYSKAMKELPALLDMHPVNFSKFINTKSDSNYEPSAKVMVKLASFFNVNVSELYSNPPSEITIEDVYTASECSISEQLNLTTQQI